MVVDISEVGMAVEALVSDYISEVDDQVREDVDAAAKFTSEMLQDISPKRTGKYAAGWSVGDDSEGAMGYGVRVYNAKKPGLAHLTSKGHALRNGGFKAGDGHVATAADAGIAELERRMASG